MDPSRALGVIGGLGVLALMGWGLWFAVSACLMARAVAHMDAQLSEGAP